MNPVLGYLKEAYDFVLRKTLKPPERHVVLTPHERVNRARVFNSILSPFETYFGPLQSLLVWERPYLSAGAFVTVNIAYWIIVAWNRRFFSILSIFALTLFCYNTWIYQVWPEIRGTPESQESESWTDLNPNTVSVPELSKHLNDFCEKMLILWKDVWKLRKENHGLFCALMCGFFSILALIGKIIPGVLIVYSTVLILSLGPGIALHLIPSTLYDQMIGYFAESDDQVSSDGSRPSGQSDKDSDIEEFIPEASAEVLRQLSFKEDTPEIPSPGMVLTESPCIEFDASQETADEFSLYSGLGGFPSVEEEGESDLEDEISDDILPKVDSAAGEMHFVPSHFKDDSSDSENENFIEGLSFKNPGEHEATPEQEDEVNKAKKPSESAKRKVSSSSEFDDELMDFEILEESDVLS
ncbi:reticulophagy regulator 3-like [Uloborus diversus]|uniref:reticulophagy regulator 3-like n=1 Tax=Uloborus diversus TaxID=327109 RepID=UPI002409AC12|nr:reticulophagy regulator 3-like [Uloborus diversus]